MQTASIESIQCHSIVNTVFAKMGLRLFDENQQNLNEIHEIIHKRKNFDKKSNFRQTNHYFHRVNRPKTFLFLHFSINL